MTVIKKYIKIKISKYSAGKNKKIYKITTTKTKDNNYNDRPW